MIASTETFADAFVGPTKIADQSGFSLQFTLHRDGALLLMNLCGELDLHTFRPAEIASLLEDYFTECRRRGLHRVRVIHGKGTGTLRATVEAQLRRSSHVVSFGPGNETSGSWGATLVTLKPQDSC